MTAGRPADFQVGNFFEDCRYEPMVCVRVSVDDDELVGVSLIDGRGPASCSISHCGPELLTNGQAVWIKENFAVYATARKAGRDIDDIIPSS
jgi:hypothetical protein